MLFFVFNSLKKKQFLLFLNIFNTYLMYILYNYYIERIKYEADNENREKRIQI